MKFFALLFALLVAGSVSAAQPKPRMILPITGEITALMSHPDFAALLSKLRAEKGDIQVAQGALQDPESNAGAVAIEFYLPTPGAACASSFGEIVADVTYQKPGVSWAKSEVTVSNVCYVEYNHQPGQPEAAQCFGSHDGFWPYQQ